MKRLPVGGEDGEFALAGYRGGGEVVLEVVEPLQGRAALFRRTRTGLPRRFRPARQGAPRRRMTALQALEATR